MTLTGTEAPYAARSGAMICTVPGVVSIWRDWNSFSRKCSHSGDESAWAAGAGRPPGAPCASGAIATSTRQPAARPSTRPMKFMLRIVDS